MAIKNILLHMDDTKACPARLDLAVDFAAAHEAQLTGMYVVPPIYISPYVAAQEGSRIREVQHDMAQQAKAEAKSVFREAAERSGISAEWRAVDGEANEVLSLHARYADLAIVGQIDPDTKAPLGSANLPEHVVLDAGGPVLVVPYAGSHRKIGERVMVAWNASREAARAVNDSLPVLERAKQVTVLVVNPKSGPRDHGDVPGADISLLLARHGVKAEAEHFFGNAPAAEMTLELARHDLDTGAKHLYVDDMEVGDVLLSRAADVGIDLIVMGAYGHSRLRELIMGGVSRHMLRQMTVPVFMSH